LALRREPAPAFDRHQRPQRAAALAAPAALAADDEFDRAMLVPVPTGPVATSARIEVFVRNLPADWPRAEAGLAIHTDDFASGLHWLPIRASEAHDGAVRIAHELPRRGRWTFAVAAHRAHALHGYLVRSSAVVGETTVVILDATAANVEFVPSDARARSTPWRLQRRDDPQWLPMHTAAGLAFANGAPARVWLGAGDYALVDPLGNGGAKAFTVPADARIPVTAGPAAPPAPLR